MMEHSIIPDEGGALCFYYDSTSSAYQSAKNLVQLLVERTGCIDHTDKYGWKRLSEGVVATPMRFYDNEAHFIGNDFIGLLEQTKAVWLSYMESAIVLDLGDEEYFKIFLTHIFYNHSFVYKYIEEGLRNVRHNSTD